LNARLWTVFHLSHNGHSAEMFQIGESWMEKETYSTSTNYVKIVATGVLEFLA